MNFTSLNRTRLLLNGRDGALRDRVSHRGHLYSYIGSRWRARADSPLQEVIRSRPHRTPGTPGGAVRPSVNVCKSGLFLATLVGKHNAAFLSRTHRTCEHGCRRWIEGALRSPATATISASGQPLQNMYMHFSAAATHLLATRGLMPAALPLLPVRKKMSQWQVHRKAHQSA